MTLKTKMCTEERSGLEQASCLLKIKSEVDPRQVERFWTWVKDVEVSVASEVGASRTTEKAKHQWKCGFIQTCANEVVGIEWIRWVQQRTVRFKSMETSNRLKSNRTEIAWMHTESKIKMHVETTSPPAGRKDGRREVPGRIARLNAKNNGF